MVHNFWLSSFIDYTQSQDFLENGLLLLQFRISFFHHTSTPLNLLQHQWGVLRVEPLCSG
jgi:hypothetical protein